MMSGIVEAFRSWVRDWSAAWDGFWFSRSSGHSLAAIRIGCGAMLAYIHLIWLVRLSDFLGPNAWIDRDASRLLHESDWAWSWLWYTDSLWLTGIHETVALIASLMMMIGLFSRIAMPLAWLLTLMTCHRLTLALFGLDQIAVMLVMYLMISDAGATWSLDQRMRSKPSRLGKTIWWLSPSGATTRNNIATRLIQIHLCVIYIFGGLSKMRGEMWYEGSALWFTLVNYEYQSFDLTWIGKSPLLIASLTAGTIFWETFYCALVWPRLTRPFALAMAFSVHAGIALALGMITFGGVMILANFAFIEPRVFQRLLSRKRQQAN